MYLAGNKPSTQRAHSDKGTAKLICSNSHEHLFKGFHHCDRCSSNAIWQKSSMFVNVIPPCSFLCCINEALILGFLPAHTKSLNKCWISLSIFLGHRRISDLNKNTNLGSTFIFKAITLPNHKGFNTLHPVDCRGTSLISGSRFSSLSKLIIRESQYWYQGI